ncbi:hypothetical protein BDV35DRAFT_385041 [Aspergillus flavus]|uniref:Uncharacterized protein n=1 Tax=Aspergillus flavus TaxID=5059 RepID=A0A5N6GIS5_ASPFL|nr:hypothetical protein BDV35DRAFT_385041 [Aspergillus flavus]
MVRLGLSFWRPCLLSLPLASTLLLWQSLKYAHLHLARVAQAFPLCDSQEYWNDKTRHMYDALGQDGKWSLLCKDWGLNILCLLKKCGLLESYKRVLKQVFISKQGYLDRFSSAMVAAAGGDEDFYSQIEDLKFQNGDDIEQMYKVLGG